MLVLRDMKAPLLREIGRASWTITKPVTFLCGCQYTLTYSAWLDTFEEHKLLNKIKNNSCPSCGGDHLPHTVLQG